jgi:hypothetical protein
MKNNNPSTVIEHLVTLCVGLVICISLLSLIRPSTPQTILALAVGVGIGHAWRVAYEHWKRRRKT